MDLPDAAGWVAMIVSVSYTCLGLPMQARKNYVNKSTAGLSGIMVIMLVLVFSSWIFYASVKSPPDWYIIVSNSPGLICAIVLLYQFRIYRKNFVG